MLFTCKLPLLLRLKEYIILNFEFKKEATRANLQVNKRSIKMRPFWNKVYGGAVSKPVVQHIVMAKTNHSSATK